MSTLRQMMEQRIRDNITEFKEVAGAANLEGILANRLTAPGCYVFRSNNRLGNAHGDQITIQPRDEHIACVIVTRNVRDARGADGSDENEAFCQKVQDVLLGQQLSSAYGSIQQSDGKLIRFKDGLFIWMDIYKAKTHIRSK